MSRLHAGWRGHCLCLWNPCSLLSCDAALLVVLPVTTGPQSLSSGGSYSLSCIHSRQGSTVGSLEAICTLPHSPGFWTSFWHLLTAAISEGSLLLKPWHKRPIQQACELFISQIPLEWMLPLLPLGELVSVFDLYLFEYCQWSFKNWQVCLALG